MTQEPKISIVEAYFLIMFGLIADLVNSIPIMNWVVTIVTLPVLYFYFRMKELPAYPNIIAGIVEFVPVLSILPATLASIIACIILDRIASRLPAPVATITKKAGGALKVP